MKTIYNKNLPFNLNNKRRKKKTSMTLLFMVLPFIILVSIFNYVPLFGWIYAFFNYRPGVSLSKSVFVGLKYFNLIFTDGGDFANSVKNTLALSFLNILCSPLPVVFALLLTEIRSKFFKKIVQTMTTLPNFISWIIVFSLAFTMFSSEGVVNQLLTHFHLIKEPTNILGDSGMVWFFQTALGVWKSIGWGTIIYLAAISGIDGELYDAAKVDGAGRFRSVVHVTIPGVIETYFVLLLLSIGNILSAGFEQYLVFYNGIVAEHITVLDLYVYRLGLVSNDYSYATAVGIFKTVISIILLFSVNKLSKKVRGNSII